MLEGDRKHPEAFRMVSVKSYSRFVEGVALPPLARFEGFHTIGNECFDDLANTAV